MRNINQIIIHCSCTEAGKHFTADDIRDWHKQDGWLDVGYHYVILLDGTIQKGRDESKIGAHCKGHNKNSIGICYIGGLQNGKAADTRTTEQNNAMKELVQDLLTRYPGATTHGHCEFANKACPCFDVASWRKEVGL